MNNDKKKMIALGGLALALVAVGAFQFIGKGSPPPVAKKSQKPSAASRAEVAQSGYVAPSESSEQTSVSGNQPGESGTDNQSNPTTPGAGAETETDPQRQFLLQMVKNPLPRRDPFDPQETPPTESAPQPAQTTPTLSPRPMHGGPVVNRYPITQPVDPLQGGNLGGSPPTNGMDVAHAAPLRQPGEFAYRVTGVIVGKKPMAVFEDDSGNQRLVPLGGSIDGDSKVVGVERGKVRIVHRGKEKTLSPLEGQ